MLRIVDGKIQLPALTSAHSHAFQRAMRGQAQRPGRDDDDFWSWREAMYRLAGELDPEKIYQFSRVAYEELHRAGVRTVSPLVTVSVVPSSRGATTSCAPFAMSSTT
jgi:formimidoylglutamate deiminase